ncbi:hypothetical protein [Micromonospora sp. CB01531]|uniref:hypothetical protein n=1 Tax=Micromonospora sp. CB01531 TaxID=1718947 RepID=UPI000AAFE37D|nr:hypothetical protein [Micromonospora sp. CB01531]
MDLLDEVDGADFRWDLGMPVGQFGEDRGHVGHEGLAADGAILRWPRTCWA